MFGQIQAEIDLAEQLARLVRNVRAQTGDVKRDGLERAAAVCEAVQRRNIPEHVGKDVVRTRGADETFQQIVVSELLGAAAADAAREVYAHQRAARGAEERVVQHGLAGACRRDKYYLPFAHRGDPNGVPRAADAHLRDVARRLRAGGFAADDGAEILPDAGAAENALGFRAGRYDFCAPYV